MPTSSDKAIAIKVRNLSKSYALNKGNANSEKIAALNKINLDIYEGEIIGIVGPNGSGKSTLLKVLSEITAPDEGYVEINGKIASILEVGTGFNPDLSGRKNIYINARFHGMKKAEVDAKFDKIVELFGFPNFLDTPVKHYSSGMYMRLAFAVVVHIDADIYLFDEVMSIGDEKFRKKTVYSIEFLRSKNSTILMVTHSPGYIGNICDNMLLLINGKKISYGNSNDVLLDYKEQILNNSFKKEKEKQNRNIRHKKDLKDIKQTLQVDLKDKFDLNSVTVNNTNNNSSSIIYAHKKINMKLICHYNSYQDLHLGFSIKNRDDIIISTHMFETLKPGNQKDITAMMTFPPNTFNETIFIVDVFLLNNKNIFIFYPNAVDFKVKDTHKYSQSWKNRQVSHINLPVEESVIKYHK